MACQAVCFSLTVAKVCPAHRPATTGCTRRGGRAARCRSRPAARDASGARRRTTLLAGVVVLLGVAEPGLLSRRPVAGELPERPSCPARCPCVPAMPTPRPRERAGLERLEEDAPGEILGVAHVAVAVAEIGHAVEDARLPGEDAARRCRPRAGGRCRGWAPGSSPAPARRRRCRWRDCSRSRSTGGLNLPTRTAKAGDTFTSV